MKAEERKTDATGCITSVQSLQSSEWKEAEASVKTADPAGQWNFKQLSQACCKMNGPSMLVCEPDDTRTQCRQLQNNAVLNTGWLLSMETHNQCICTARSKKLLQSCVHRFISCQSHTLRLEVPAQHVWLVVWQQLSSSTATEYSSNWAQPTDKIQHSMGSHLVIWQQQMVEAGMSCGEPVTMRPRPANCEGGCQAG